MMISQAMNAQLNKQITAEFAASHSYLAMACHLDDMGLKVMSKRFIQQSDEERAHAMKILGYVLEVGGNVKLESVAGPKTDWGSLEEIVEAALEAERDVTRMINELVELAEKDKDYATRSFLTFFVDEQVEEVSSMTDLLNLVKLAKGNVLQIEVAVRHMMMAAQHK